MSATTEEPIKFRCYKCNKLLGVPARKVGSTVSCPQCQADLQVPRLEAASAAPAPTNSPEIAVEAVSTTKAAADLSLPEVLASVAASATSTSLDESLIAAISVDTPSIRPNREPSERPVHDVVISPVIVLAWSLLVLMAIPLAFLAGLLTGHFVWK